VQSPEEAAHPSIPQSALEHVAVDAVLPVAKMPELLVQWTSERIEPSEAKVKSNALEIENRMALNDGVWRQDGFELGPFSSVTCPQCYGVMVRIEEGTIVRLRCHTGHAYSMRSLVADVNAEIDHSLWSTIRVIEERVFLLHEMAKLAKQEVEAREYLKQARWAEQRVEQLRQIVMTPNELGHDAAEPEAVGYEQA
jgi:two-component system, chemotaxis family, protein-glutamate methylesterase/glutaminase